MWKPNNKQNIIFINAAIFDSKGKSKQINSVNKNKQRTFKDNKAVMSTSYV